MVLCLCQTGRRFPAGSREPLAARGRWDPELLGHPREAGPLLLCSASAWREKASHWEVTQTSAEKGSLKCHSQHWGN